MSPSQHFIPSNRRWQAIVVVRADKRGRPIERQTLRASTPEHLTELLADHIGLIEEAGLYTFEHRRIFGIFNRITVDLLEPLLLPADWIYLPAAEVWRQKHERVPA